MEKKKFNPMVFIILYLALSFGTIIASILTKISWLITFGIVVLFGGGFAISLAVVIALFKKSNQKVSESNYDAKQDDSISKEKVNSSTGIDHKYKLANYEIGMVIREYKASNKKEKILGTILLIYLLALPIAAIIFINLRIELGFFICFGIFVGSIIILAIGKKIKEKRAMSTKKINKDAPRETATVIVTTVSSFNTFGTGSERLGTSRITSMTYKVRLNVHGKEIVTYSRDFYNEGEKVKVILSKNGKNATIVNEPIDEEIEND